MPVHRVLTPGIRFIRTPVFNISKDVNYIQHTCHRCLVKDHSNASGVSQTSQEITTESDHLSNSEKDKRTHIIRSVSQNESSTDKTHSDFIQEFYEGKKLNEDLVTKENPVCKVTKTPPDPPTDCCMSGCANCVWITYAEEMKEFYSADGIEKALKDIEAIEDVSLKAFLKVELSFLKKQ